MTNERIFGSKDRNKWEQSSKSFEKAGPAKRRSLLHYFNRTGYIRDCDTMNFVVFAQMQCAPTGSTSQVTAPIERCMAAASDGSEGNVAAVSDRSGGRCGQQHGQCRALQNIHRLAVKCEGHLTCSIIVEKRILGLACSEANKR